MRIYIIAIMFIAVALFALVTVAAHDEGTAGKYEVLVPFCTIIFKLFSFPIYIGWFNGKGLGNLFLPAYIINASLWAKLIDYILDKWKSEKTILLLILLCLDSTISLNNQAGNKSLSASLKFGNRNAKPADIILSFATREPLSSIPDISPNASFSIKAGAAGVHIFR